MKIQPVLAICLALLIVGCKGGKKPSAVPATAERTGVFQAGGVSGLRYVTPTRSGLTDAAGSFKYLDGESVTFSIGGIALGSAPGAALITPFTIVGMTPPTTEPALRRELDRASRIKSSFVRAVNIVRLLMVLDADRNPTNGLDLQGRDQALAGSTLNLDQTIPSFVIALEKLAPDLTHNLPHWLPVVQLYRALGIAVPATAIKTYEHVYSDNIAIATSFSYYPNGSLKSWETIDGSYGGTSSMVAAYDALGRTTNDRRKYLYAVSPGQAMQTVTRFDSSGNLQTSSWDVDEGVDGLIDSRFSTEFETDAYANIHGQVSRLDIADDGVIEQIDTYVAHLDPRMNTDHTTTEVDDELDGEIEQRHTMDAIFDESNRARRFTYQSDWEADGHVDSREILTIDYSTDNRQVSERQESDDDGNGVADNVERREWVLDGNGTAETLTIERLSYHVNYRPDFLFSRTVVKFDSDGRVLTVDERADWDGDGVFEHHALISNSYDGFGNVKETVHEFDDDDDGDFDYRSSLAYEYGPSAELKGSVMTDRSSPWAEPRTLYSVKVASEALPDGVLLLAQRYLESGFNIFAIGVMDAGPYLPTIGLRY